MRTAPASVFSISSFLRLTGLLAAASVLNGCPPGGTLDMTGGSGGSTGSGGGTGAFCDATPIFVEKCSGSLCHSSTTATPPGGGVDLVNPPSGMTLGQSLLNQPATYPGYPMGACPPAVAELIINEAAPAQSLLLTKVNDTAPCGDKMPPAPIRLEAEELTCLTEWVNGIAQTGGL